MKKFKTVIVIITSLLLFACLPKNKAIQPSLTPGKAAIQKPQVTSHTPKGKAARQSFSGLAIQQAPSDTAIQQTQSTQPSQPSHPAQQTSSSSSNPLPQQQTLPEVASREKKAEISPKIEASPLYGNLLSDIKVSKDSFNPSMGEEVSFSFSLAQPAKVTLSVYDPDNSLIKTIADSQMEKGGLVSMIWDGKDQDGLTVPDEAYYFTIEAKAASAQTEVKAAGAQAEVRKVTKVAEVAAVTEVYDPTTFSGGVEHDITDADIDMDSQTINYTLPEMGRVGIRMGTQGGPLLNNLVDWRPRIASEATESWNGKDKDNIIDLRNDPQFKMVITYFTLPENSVITYGQTNYIFREYKTTKGNGRPIKKERTRKDESSLSISSHYGLPRTIDFAPTVLMTFPESNLDEASIPILSNKALVRVELGEKDRPYFTNQQFEVVFFIDGEFYTEAEMGYVPYNWLWNLQETKEGEHVLTVNISSFRDQIGICSKKVKVTKGNQKGSQETLSYNQEKPYSQETPSNSQEKQSYNQEKPL